MSREDGGTVKARPPGRSRALPETILPVRRRAARHIQIKPAPARKRAVNPQVTLIGGFLLIVVIGTVLLALPFASETGEFTPLVDALFTSTSATGTVGLVVVDTATHWSPAGEAVILILMQVGGLGFMAGAIVLFLALGRRVSIHQRRVFQESLALRQIGGLPGLARRLLIYTLVIEGVGAALLYLEFSNDPSIGSTAAWWSAVFHAVSAFTGSGFDLMGDFTSLSGQATRPLVLLTMMFMIIPGDLGFMVVLDALRARRFRKLATETKIVLSLNFALWPIAALGFLMLEFSNELTLGAFSVPHRVMNAVFHAVTVRNAGFSTVPFAEVGTLALMFLMTFMIIGAASASMGGGIKVNTVGALLAAMRAGLLGRPNAEAFGRTIPNDRIYVGITLLMLYIGWIFIAAPIMFALHAVSTDFIPSLFDTISALGPIGLSTGMPRELNEAGKVFMSVLMFVGRLGPLTVALALLRRSARRSLRRYPECELKIG